MRARVAHAGCSTATTSDTPVDPLRSQMPTQLAADQLLPAGEHGLHDRGRRGRAQPAQQAGHRVAHRSRAAVAPPPASRGSQALHREEPGHHDPLGQRRRRREDRLPGRQLGHQGAAAGRVQLGEDVVEEQGRDRAASGRG